MVSAASDLAVGLFHLIEHERPPCSPLRTGGFARSNSSFLQMGFVVTGIRRLSRYFSLFPFRRDAAVCSGLALT